ncbi:hypothetical protein LCGC14_1212920 [marine sediment metagenome]|uniref:Uncharacterized protein n=1 Tax=marine sediment metagenome TaxID=412755 RepID=A0A0F9PI59_9ZZZZ
MIKKCVVCGEQKEHAANGKCASCYQKEWRQTENGKASIKKYQQSDRCKASQEKYQQSDKGKETKKKNNHSDQHKRYIKEYNKTYHKSEAFEAALKKYYYSDKGKETRKKYQQSDRFKEVQRKRLQRQACNILREAKRDAILEGRNIEDSILFDKEFLKNEMGISCQKKK